MTTAADPTRTGVSSPCTGVCRMDARGLCQGCCRNMREIAGWGRMSEAERRHIMRHVLPQRRTGAN